MEIICTLKAFHDLHAGFGGTGVNTLEDDVAGSGQVDAGCVGDVHVKDKVVILAGLDVLDERYAYEAVVVTVLVILDAALVPGNLVALAVKHAQFLEQVIGIQQRIDAQFNGRRLQVDGSALIGEHGEFLQMVALLGIELQDEVLVHRCASAMFGGLLERERVEGVHVKGILGREDQPVIGIFPSEVALQGRVKREGVACRCAVHVPVEGQDDGCAALDGGVALMPHGSVVHHHGRCVAYALQVEVLVGGSVGGNGHRRGLAEVAWLGYLYGIGAGIDILEGVDTVPQGVGLGALYLGAVIVQQAHCGVVDGHQVVVAIDEEGLGALLQALDAVVAHVA